jgi:hypothetical protein
MRNVIAAIAIVILAATSSAAAQNAGQTQGERIEQRLAQMKERLQLTPEQVEQVKPILADEMQALKNLRDQYDGGGQSRRGRLKLARQARDIQSKSDERLKKILSKSQMDELKKIREELRQQLRSRSGRA